MLKIQFKVKAECLETEQINIVGSLPQLGNWNPYGGLKLDRTSYAEWQSFECIQIEPSLKFEFKLIKIKPNNEIEWQKLPNNSNRKFKPKFNSKLIIIWSSAEGKVVNESRRSYKVKGLPGAIITNRQVQKKSSIFDPYKIAMNSQSDQSDSENFAFLQKKVKEQPRIKINKGDIEEIYYDTTEVQLNYGMLKKPKIYFITKNLSLQSKFIEKIMEQIDHIENISFKWIYCENEEKKQPIKHKRISFYSLPKGIINEKNMLKLKQINQKNSYFIILDLSVALKTEIKDVTACLYLQGNQYEQVQQYIQYFQNFNFIVFSNAQKNHKFYQFLKSRKSQEQSDSQHNQHHLDKQIQNVSLSGIVQQLMMDRFGNSMKLNTVSNLSQNQAIQQICQRNSFLIIDCQLIKINQNYFKRLINKDIKNRMIVIIGQNADNLKKYTNESHLTIITNNFQKFKYKGKLHEPIRRHKEIIQTLEMKARLSKEIYGGECEFRQSCLIYRNQGKTDLLKKIENEIKIVIKDFNYFKISLKKDRIKLTWNLAPQIRLIRTLCRLKYLSDGNLGDFHIVSTQQNFSQLKDQIKLLIEFRNIFLENGLDTKVQHYSYGYKIPAKYTIIPQSSMKQLQKKH